jgi:tetratricopeptide (TPR) repeat protein
MARALIRIIVIAFLTAAAPAQTAERAAELIEIENEVEMQLRPKPWARGVAGTPLSIRDGVRTGEFSRAAVRLGDRGVMRLDELTTFEVTPPSEGAAKPGIDLKQGGAYFFSRERTPEIRIATPAANGALRGTQLVVRVTPALKTIMTILEGEVELSNALGSILLSSGEQGEAEPGRPPRRTAVLEATNILQWALYYPGVLNPDELGIGPADASAVAASLAAYRTGDLLGALEKYPQGHRPASAGGRAFRAAVRLAVGRVDDAELDIRSLGKGTPARVALEHLIAAVKFVEYEREAEPATAGEWMGLSYYEQSRSRLEAALAAAEKAVEAAPEFGYAWVRLAELHFSFGRTPKALAALDRGLEWTPRNAQGHALRGFLLSAQNRIGAARDAFNQAIDLDGALGNAWLGRGLTYIRQGEYELGRLDLQTAAAMEPNRSILHSYSGKAFSQAGDNVAARKDLFRAKELDPNDPTPWLYSALQNKQENRYNQAVDDLEKSIDLNENRRVYRSQFLLDQDRAIRGANLASIYLNNGLLEQSVREAVRAVNSDYSSAPAHLFLSNSYNALRDPARIQLRYETAWFNERLLANLLAPVGGGSLSQYVSQQEYSKLFEGDGLGFSTQTDYFSYGELRSVNSQYGTFGNFSYALDAEYLYTDGIRPNSEISRLESYAIFKLQLSPQDTVFLQAKVQDLQNGDVRQRFDPREVDRDRAALTLDFRERQEPGLLLLGYHRQWDPGQHTLLLFGRLANDQVLTLRDSSQSLVTREVPGRDFGSRFTLLDPSSEGQLRSARRDLREADGRGTLTGLFSDVFDLDYRADFETYSAEWNQILTLQDHTLIFGVRGQFGEFNTQAKLTDFANEDLNDLERFFGTPPLDQNVTVDFERINIYLYDVWQITPWLSITGGLTYDSLRYPDNFRSPPLNEEQETLEKLSPKAGLTLQPWKGAVLRGAYAEAISGSSFDESIRLEPTQVNGFVQAYRTLISESLVGSVAGNEYRIWGLSFEQKLPTRTYLGIEYQVLEQDVTRTLGAFDFYFEDGVPIGAVPGSLTEMAAYREEVLTASINQLAGENWSFGARYRYTRSRLDQTLDDFRGALDRPSGEFLGGGLDGIAFAADRTRESELHEISLSALYNHPTGFFARAEANWFMQENDDYVRRVRSLGSGRERAKFGTDNIGNPGDDFWQLNAIAGWRFYKNQCELSCGVLNITGTDYQLDPLNYYLEIPRDRTFFVRMKFTF